MMMVGCHQTKKPYTECAFVNYNICKGMDHFQKTKSHFNFETMLNNPTTTAAKIVTMFCSVIMIRLIIDKFDISMTKNFNSSVFCI